MMKKIYPRTGDTQTVYLNAVVKDPSIEVDKTAEIRCQLVCGSDYQPTTYQTHYFQPDSKGKLEIDNGTEFLPNDL